MKMKEDEQSKMEATEKETIPKLIRHFLGYTTAHGFSRLGESKGIFWKVFWALVCMGSFGMFVYQARGLFLLYLSRPVTTSVRITFEKQVPFPAVTICNLNMLREDKISNQLKEEMLKLAGTYNTTVAANSTRPRRRRRRDISTRSLEFTKSTTSHRPGGTTSKPFGTFHTTKNSFSGNPRYGTTYSSRGGHTTGRSHQPSGGYNPTYGYKDDTEFLPSEEEVDQNVLKLERFTTAVTKVPVTNLSAAGHQLEDLVQECTWRGYDCKESNSSYSKFWYQRWHYKYGNCYTFNGGLDRDSQPIRVLSTSKPGPSQGLSLRLDVQQHEYLTYVSAEVGVRVMLHDQGMMPFPFLEGFSVSPGMATSVGIQKTLISRVDRFNNHTCWNIDELENDNIYKEFYNITKYTQQTCHNSCLGKTQLKICGCAEYSYPSNTSACDTFNPSTRDCLWKVHYKFNNDLLPCMEECRQPCREDIIQKTISMSRWPSTKYQLYEREKNRNFSSESVLLLNIFYNELNYQRIEESFVYDEINLLADIGGQLGLWIGVSVITVFELIELFVLITLRLFRKQRNNDRANNITLP